MAKRVAARDALGFGSFLMSSRDSSPGSEHPYSMVLYAKGWIQVYSHVPLDELNLIQCVPCFADIWQFSFPTVQLGKEEKKEKEGGSMRRRKKKKERRRKRRRSWISNATD